MKTVKQASVFKHGWGKISRVWAENGICNAENGETGKVEHLTPKQMATRLLAINDMAGQCPDINLRKQMLEFVDSSREVLSEALRQREGASKTSKTNILTSLLSNKTLDGKPVTDNERTPEMRLNYFMAKYPVIDPDDIKRLIKREELPDHLIEEVLDSVNKGLVNKYGIKSAVSN